MRHLAFLVVLLGLSPAPVRPSDGGLEVRMVLEESELESLGLGRFTGAPVIAGRMGVQIRVRFEALVPADGPIRPVDFIPRSQWQPEYIAWRERAGLD